MQRRPSACEEARAEVFRLAELMRALEAAIQHERSSLVRARSQPVGVQCWVGSPNGAVERDCSELREEEITRHETRLSELLARRAELERALAAARQRVQRECGFG
jgi:hypothetical protein